MPKLSEMNLTLNAKAVEGIMTVKRENQELKRKVAELEANIQSMGRATDGLRKSSEVMANELPRALARVAELGGEREVSRHSHALTVEELSNSLCDTGVAEARAVELQAQLERATKENRVTRRAVTDLADSLGVHERKAPHLTLISCCVQVGSNKRAASERGKESTNMGKAKEQHDVAQLRTNPTAIAMLEEWLEHARSGELQHVCINGEYPYGQAREQDSRTVTFEVEGMRPPSTNSKSHRKEAEKIDHTPKPAEPRPVGDVCQECLGSGWPLMKGERLKRLTEPRPMSEAPQDGTPIRLVYPSLWSGSTWMLGAPLGWLPTSSGGEGDSNES